MKYYGSYGNDFAVYDETGTQLKIEDVVYWDTIDGDPSYAAELIERSETWPRGMQEAFGEDLIRVAEFHGLEKPLWMRELNARKLQALLVDIKNI